MKRHSWEDVTPPNTAGKVWRCRGCGSERERSAPRRTYAGNRIKHDWMTRDVNGRRCALRDCEYMPAKETTP